MTSEGRLVVGRWQPGCFTGATLGDDRGVSPTLMVPGKREKHEICKCAHLSAILENTFCQSKRREANIHIYIK